MSGVHFGQLLAVINGCVAPEPTRRLTVPHVLDTLTTLQRDVAATVPAAGGEVRGHDVSAAVTPPPVPAPAALVYDVLTIVAAMETLRLDSVAVIDAIGGVTASPLDVLRDAGVPFINVMAIKRALATTAAGLSASITTIKPAVVGGSVIIANSYEFSPRLGFDIMVCRMVTVCVCVDIAQLDFGAVIDELVRQGYDGDKLNELGERLGVVDSVSVEQLARAGVPSRVVFDLRRRLDPRNAAAEVR